MARSALAQDIVPGDFFYQDMSEYDKIWPKLYLCVWSLPEGLQDGMLQGRLGVIRCEPSHRLLTDLTWRGTVKVVIV
jgi:hypothetical protein